MDAKKRFTFIDLLKGWALLVMIEVHVVNAFIMPEFKTAPWFSVLNFINGLVAPSFTFISGFAFIISSKSGLDEMRSFGKKFWKKLSRILLLFLAGYALHMPEFSFRNIMQFASHEQIVKWYNVDVLQCIGFSLLVLFIARLIIKSDKVYNNFILYTGIAIIFLSPFVWQIDFAKFLPLPIASYFNEMHGSFFPLFPWMGFLFAGAYACILYMKFRSEGRERWFINKILIYGAAAAIISTILIKVIKLFIEIEHKPNPLFFFERLGIVLFALALCWFYAEKTGEKSSFVTEVSRESLMVYFMHLQVIYRKIWNYESLDKIINFRFGIMECIYATIILTAAMIAAAKIWGGFKFTWPKFSTAAIRIFILIVVVLFFYLT